MNKKSLVLIGFMVFGVLIFRGSKMWNIVVNAVDDYVIQNTIKIACEYPNGDLKVVNDDFTRKEYCRNNGRLVNFGVVIPDEKAPGVMDVLYAGYSTLMKDGTVWEYQVGYDRWDHLSYMDLTTVGISPGDVVQWNGSDHFLTKNGDIYRFVRGDGGIGGGWINAKRPLINQ